MQPTTSTDAVLLDGLSRRRRRVVSHALLAASFPYALTATAALPHRLSLTDAATVFSAGATPGLLVVLLLWMARPQTFDRPLRQAMVVVTLAGAALVAAAPCIIVGG